MRRMAENETRGNGTEWIVVLFHDCRSQSQLADTTFAIQSQPVRIYRTVVDLYILPTVGWMLLRETKN